MPTEVEVVVIGAGHAGLAMSHCLTANGIDHVVLERGRTGERWRTARWDSFRMLTPNWMSRLPGWSYAGGEPEGFMTADQFVAYLSGYAQAFHAPVREQTSVTSVTRSAGGYLVRTDRGCWRARQVVIATGYQALSRVPEVASALSPSVAQLTSAGYRNPGGLPAGRVLVVGASASGAQIADELARAGREVVLAVGAHTRLPRRYRGRDILWWLARTGSLRRTIDELPDPNLARSEPSLQLVGSAEGRSLDLSTLAALGVRFTGRLRQVDGTQVEFAGDLHRSTAEAESRLHRVLDRIDALASRLPNLAVGPPDRPAPIGPVTGPDRLDLRRSGITSVVWATGLRPWYPWLRLPVLDEHGYLRHRRGVTELPGLYAIGLRFQHRRDATFVDGARHDAAYLTDQILAHRHRCGFAATGAGPSRAVGVHDGAF
ncbi:MAG TPA: NAD(P)-binding domain-containing protein [Micromonosporaceae bacterium]